VVVERVLRIASEDAGERLDKVLVRRLPGIGRRAAGDLFASGAVRIRGRCVPKSALAVAGDEVVVNLPKPDFSEPLDLDVVLESAHYVVVHKPAGQATSPLREGDRGTLAQALLHHYPEMQATGYRLREAGLVHRLDTQTSGLLLAARNELGFHELVAASKRGELEKTYLAIVRDTDLPESSVIDRAIVPSRRGAARVEALADEPSASVGQLPTRFHVARRSRGWALLEISVQRAYRHQVRVHLAAIGHPIAGDLLYGGAATEELGARHALHASRLSWIGSATVAGFDVSCPLPETLGRLLGD
jgi:23S rRNA pseudouridine1911/1915/1917 synthase